MRGYYVGGSLSFSTVRFLCKSTVPCRSPCGVASGRLLRGVPGRMLVRLHIWRMFRLMMVAIFAVIAAVFPVLTAMEVVVLDVVVKHSPNIATSIVVSGVPLRLTKRW